MSDNLKVSPWGVGTDILKIDRIRRLADPDDPFFSKAFTAKERQIAVQWPDPCLFYATRFAAKEAVFKALRVDLSQFDMSHIEIGVDSTGKPTVRLLEDLAEHARQKGGLQVMLSLSHNRDYAIAYAFAVIADKRH